MPVWPRQYASSCLSSAEGEAKPAAMAAMAACEAGEAAWFCLARCLREKRARKSTGRGVVSVVSVVRRAVIVERVVSSEVGGVAIFAVVGVCA